ncbi:MAG: transglycosylase SLT domain-containing protein, partial [Ferruginibacter sp.]
VEKTYSKRAKVQVDDRKNFIRSTYAAARYLKDRSRNLNSDWLLIAASYNCGVGNVWEAMERSKKKDPSFWDIKNYLPAETRAYVMNFITLNVIFKNYENFYKNNLCFKPVLATFINQKDSSGDTDISIKE